MSSDLDDDVALFQLLRQKLLDRLDAHEEDLRSSLEKAREAKRDVSGRGHRGSAASPGTGTQGDRVLTWLRANPGRHAVADIARAAGLDRASTNQVLIVLIGAKLISRPARGLYEVKAWPPLLPPSSVAAARSVEVLPAATDRADGPPRRETPIDRMRRMNNARGGAR